MTQSDQSTQSSANTRQAGGYRFRLFVAGNEPNSKAAKKNLQKICDEYLKDCHDIELIDVLTDFEAALKHKVIVTPTLMITRPERHARVIGTLEDRQKVLDALQIGR